MRCAHLHPADEAYAIGTLCGGDCEPITVHICEWPDQHPERFVGAPTWLLKLVGGGLAVTPERDCVGCPGFKPTSDPGRFVPAGNGEER